MTNPDDLRIAEAEHLAQDEYGPLVWREGFQHNEHGQRDRFVKFGPFRNIGF
jgi:hypothetical protein